MTNSFRSSIYLDFYRFHRYISEHTSLHKELKTEFMQTVNFLTTELQLRVEGSNNYHLTKKLRNDPISSLKQGLKSSSDR